MLYMDIEKDYHVVNTKNNCCVMSTNDLMKAEQKANDAALVTGNEHKVFGLFSTTHVKRETTVNRSVVK